MRVDWLGANVQICLDDVDEVGQFVELELVVAEPAEIDKAKETLFALADKVGLSGSIRTSYLQLLLENRGLV
jgi:predicted adenylyl cyclase CyaB